MQFGVTNAPATFQRLMNKVFAGNLDKFIAVYLDDILIFSRNMDEHWQHCQWALEQLRKAKLYGRLHKCEFLKDQVDYLGLKSAFEESRPLLTRFGQSLSGPDRRVYMMCIASSDWHHTTDDL